MKPYYRACAFALLMPLLWTASAQEAKPDPALEKESEIQLIEFTGEVIKFLSPGDYDELIGSLDAAQRISFDNGKGTLYFDKRGDDSRVILVSRKSAADRLGKSGRTGIAELHWLLRDPGLFTGRNFSMNNNRASSVAKSAELLKLESRVRKLSETARSAQGDELEKLEDELRTLLDEIFDLKQKERTAEIESMQARIDAFAVQRDERASIQQAIVERRLDQLLGRSSKYDW